MRVAHWNNVRSKRVEYLSLRYNYIDQWNYEEKYCVYGAVHFPASASHIHQIKTSFMYSLLEKLSLLELKGSVIALSLR